MIFGLRSNPVLLSHRNNQKNIAVKCDERDTEIGKRKKEEREKRRDKNE